MKVKCIKSNIWYLTIGKIYEVIDNDDGNYKIIDDTGFRDWYPKEYFKTLLEIRNEKINKLLK